MSNSKVPKVAKNMEKNSDEQFIIMQAAIEDYNQDSDEKMKKLSEEFKIMFEVLSNYIKTLSY